MKINNYIVNNANRKKISILFLITSIALILIGVFLLNLNFSSEQEILREAHKKSKISSLMSSYEIFYFIGGDLEDFGYVTIENYENKKYKVTIQTFDENQKNSVVEVMYILDGVAYSEISDDKYIKLDEKIIYNNTEIYLTGLLEAEKISYVGLDKIVGREYKKYSFIVKTKIVKKILNYTKKSNLSFDKENIECMAWIDEEGYIDRIDYYLFSGIENNEALILTVYVKKYNQIEDFTLDLE